MGRINLRLPDELEKHLNEQALAAGLSLSEYIRKRLQNNEKTDLFLHEIAELKREFCKQKIEVLTAFDSKHESKSGYQTHPISENTLEEWLLKLNIHIDQIATLHEFVELMFSKLLSATLQTHARLKCMSTKEVETHIEKTDMVGQVKTMVEKLIAGVK